MSEEKPNDATEVPTAKEVIISETIPPPANDNGPEPEEHPKKLLQETNPAWMKKNKPTRGVSLAVAFKEERNRASELPDPDQKALDELKQLLRSALANGAFSPPQRSPNETASAEPKPDEDDDAKTVVESIAEIVVPPARPPASATEVIVNEVFIWGIPLIGDERSDTILLKFLRARDFKPKEALAMIKNTIQWRRVFNMEGLIKEDLGVEEMEKAVFMSGADREGHPICYNAYGEFQNAELYAKAFGDEEKKQRFLRWRIQYLEKGIRELLDFRPGGISTMIQVTDLKNSPGPLKREFREALSLLLDNYPEFVKKQVFINVPWWYLAFNRVISPFLTQRTKSKFVFAGPSKSAETLFRYISPEQVPVQFGGLHGVKDSEFTIADAVTEINIKPTSSHTIEIQVTGPCFLIWELRVLEWEISYGAEFVPNSSESYTVILHKTRKMAVSDDPVVKSSFKVCGPGKILLTAENTSNRRKMLLYRFKLKKTEFS
ncbi:Patellin-5 [Platanthera zijinensis]|uniref:Patellin-5 n=1 Tax=Platanthera zijinensis TaxID=2320716 RepID=A0AAP0GCE3_9ASPA